MTRDELANLIRDALVETPWIINRARISPAEALELASRIVSAVAPRGYLPSVQPARIHSGAARAAPPPSGGAHADDEP